MFPHQLLYIFDKENSTAKNRDEEMVKNLKKTGLVKKTDNVLDYGCGLGTWNNEIENNGIFFNKLFLYDKNPEAREHCKKKYPNHIVINEINDKLDINLIFSNSVIQYLNTNELKKLFEQFSKILKKDEVVILSGNPKYPRILECVLTFFTNFDLFKIQIKQFFKSDYIMKTNFYIHSIDEIILLTKNNFSVTKIEEIEPNKNRDTIVLKKNN